MRLVAKGVARTEFKAQLSSGQKIKWPYITDLRVQDYTPGTDLAIDANTAVDDFMNIDQSKAATFTLDPNQQAQAEDKTIQAKLANQAAFQIGNNIDQAVISTGVNGANNTVTGGTLNVSNIYSKLCEGMASLSRANAMGTKFAILDPERISLLAQHEVANGWNVADNALANGFVGGSSAGFKVYSSNNLPTSVVLTVDTQPANGDTFTIAGVTWTCVTDGTAASAGEVNIGADLADFKTIVVAAINGSTSSDYVDVSTENRRKLQNAQVSAATFSSNDCTITAFGKLSPSETFTTATNVFGTETGSCLLGDTGAISLGMQIMPQMYVGKEPKRPEQNYIIHTLFGKKVFYRDADKLVNLTINV